MSPTIIIPQTPIEATIDALFETSDMPETRLHGYLSPEQEKQIHAAQSREEALKLLESWGYNVRRA
jgi:hypothetical protein